MRVDACCIIEHAFIWVLISCYSHGTGRLFDAAAQPRVDGMEDTAGLKYQGSAAVAHGNICRCCYLISSGRILVRCNTMVNIHSPDKATGSEVPH